MIWLAALAVALGRIAYMLHRTYRLYGDQVTADARHQRFLQVCSLAAADRDQRRRHR